MHKSSIGAGGITFGKRGGLVSFPCLVLTVLMDVKE